MSFSIILRRQEVREIGLYFPKIDLGIRKRRECCQSSGKYPFLSISL